MTATKVLLLLSAMGAVFVTETALGETADAIYRASARRATLTAWFGYGRRPRAKST